MPFTISQAISAVTAIGALGTASFGLVDATKALGGGISHIGFGDIRKAIRPLFGAKPSSQNRSTPLAYGAVLDNLRSNWMNGRDLSDQKAIAKTLLKLRLNAKNAGTYAANTGVDAAELTAIADKINLAQALLPPEADAFGRFDLALTALLDQAYQRGDQRYRNSAKIAAGFVAVIIAVLCGWALSNAPLAVYWDTAFMWKAALAGLLATPLAPIAKDLSSALAAGADVAQKIRSRR